MKKEDVYLDLTKLTKEQLINVAEVAKDEMYYYSYEKLSKGITSKFGYLLISDEEWVRSKGTANKKEISYDEFLNLFQDKEVEVRKECLENCFGVDFDKLKEAGIDFNQVTENIKETIDKLVYNEYQPKEDNAIGLNPLDFDVKLEVGKTFELNGYICEVKEKTEEKKWYKVSNNDSISYDKLSESDKLDINKLYTIIEITDYHFINLLERYSK